MKFKLFLVYISVALFMLVAFAIPANRTAAEASDKAQAAECAGNPDGKCEFNQNGALDKDPTPPAANRPYFDACGNQYDYQGNLISQGSGCPTTTPPTPVYIDGEVFTGK